MANKVTITGDASSAVAALGRLASAFASVDAQTKRTQAALGLSNAELARFSGSASAAAASSSALTSAVARYTNATRESVAATNAAIGGFQRGTRNSDQFKTAQQSLAAAASAAAKAQIAAAQQSIAALQARIPVANAVSRAEIQAAIQTLQAQIVTQQGIANAMDRKVQSIERARQAYLRMASDAQKSSQNTQRFFNDTAAGAPLASAAMVAFGQTLTDASFFAQSAASGFIAIGNNLSQLVTIFTIGAAQAGNFAGFMKLIAASFKGPLGILFALQAAIGLTQAFVLAKRKSASAAKEQADAIKGLSIEMADLNAVIKRYTAVEALSQITRIQQVRDAINELAAAEARRARLQGAQMATGQFSFAFSDQIKAISDSDAEAILGRVTKRFEEMGFSSDKVDEHIKAVKEELQKLIDTADAAQAREILLEEILGGTPEMLSITKDLSDQYKETIANANGAQQAALLFGKTTVEANSEAASVIKSTVESLIKQREAFRLAGDAANVANVQRFIDSLMEMYDGLDVVREGAEAAKKELDDLLSSVVSLQSAFEPATASLDEYRTLLGGLKGLGADNRFGLSEERIKAEIAALEELITTEEERLRLQQFAVDMGIVFPRPETFQEAIARIQAEAAYQLSIDIAVSPFASEDSMIRAQAALSLIQEKMATALEFGEEGAFGDFLVQAREAAQVIEDLKIVEMLDNSRIGVEQALADTEMTFADKFAAISSEREKLRDKLNDPLLTDEQRASVAAALEGIEGEFVFRFGKMLDSAQVFGDSIAKIFNSFSDILKAKGQMLANEQKALADKRQEEIDAIVDAAKTQNRDLTDAERQKIESIKQQGDAEIANLQRQRKRKFETEKKFAIASAIVYGALGVARAFAENSFPQSAFIAASIIAATAAQVMTIRAQQLGAAPTLRTPSISAGRGGGGGGSEGSRRFFLRPAVSDASQASSAVPAAAMGVSPSAPSVNVTGSVHMRGADAVIMLENAKMVGERV